MKYENILIISIVFIGFILLLKNNKNNIKSKKNNIKNNESNKTNEKDIEYYIDQYSLEIPM